MLAAAVGLAPLPARAELDYRGVAVGLWGSNPNTTYLPQFREVQSLGANAVLFPVLLYVDTVAGSTVYPIDGRTTPDAVLRRAAREAQELGLRTALMPVVRIEHRVDREWRGQLAPVDRDAFFASYGEMLGRYAALAESVGVDLFLIGSELASLEDAPHWGPLIERVRAAYHGAVSYSANWDHYEHVPFWSALDALALTGYYELSDTFDPTQAQLTASWQAVRANLESWQAQHPGKRIIFTEVGYPAQDGGAATPWDYTLANPVDLEEQRMCYEAFITTWRGHPALAGVFFWEWTGAGGPQDGHYTPRGKPAAAEMRAYFTDDAAAAGPAE